MGPTIFRMDLERSGRGASPLFVKSPEPLKRIGALASRMGRLSPRPPVPSAIVRLGTKDPIVFSHVASDVAMPAPTLAAPHEEAFSVHVHHTRLSQIGRAHV